MEHIIRRLTYELWIESLIKRAVVRLPFLAVGWINPVFTWVFYKVADWIWDESVDFITFHFIKYRNETVKRTFLEGVEKFKNEAPTLNEKEIMNGPYRKTLRNNARKFIRIRLRAA